MKIEMMRHFLKWISNNVLSFEFKAHLFVHALQVFSDVMAPLWDVRAVDICQGGMVFGSFFGLIHQLLPDLHGGKQLPAISPEINHTMYLQKRSDLRRPLKY